MREKSSVSLVHSTVYILLTKEKDGARMDLSNDPQSLSSHSRSQAGKVAAQGQMNQGEIGKRGT